MCRKRASAALLALFFVGGPELLANDVDLSLIANKGWIQFTVGGDWKILKLDTKSAYRVVVFQIPNTAEEGTSDSTNAAVVLSELNSSEASARFDKLRRKHSNGTTSRIGAWEVVTNDFKQANTNYSGQTAFRDIADVHVAVVLAWPHLAKNKPGYDSEMKRTFGNLLVSVNGALSKYPKEKGGVVRHPL